MFDPCLLTTAPVPQWSDCSQDPFSRLSTPPPLNGLYTIRSMESSGTGCSSVGLLVGGSVVSVITGLYLRISRGIQIVLRSVSLRRKK